MSTNFYWIGDADGVVVTYKNGYRLTLEPDRSDPGIHIGKRSGVGGGHSTFMFAQWVQNVVSVCEANPSEECAVDEYGHKYTGDQLMEELRKCTHIDRSLIGKHFC